PRDPGARGGGHGHRGSYANPPEPARSAGRGPPLRGGRLGGRPPPDPGPPRLLVRVSVRGVRRARAEGRAARRLPARGHDAGWNRGFDHRSARDPAHPRRARGHRTDRAGTAPRWLGLVPAGGGRYLVPLGREVRGRRGDLAGARRAQLGRAALDRVVAEERDPGGLVDLAVHGQAVAPLEALHGVLRAAVVAPAERRVLPRAAEVLLGPQDEVAGRARAERGVVLLHAVV